MLVQEEEEVEEEIMRLEKKDEDGNDLPDDNRHSEHAASPEDEEALEKVRMTVR